jgi:hypothetical protein
MRLNPRQPRSHLAYTRLAIASFGAKQYAEGVRSASRALGDMPGHLAAHLHLTTCLVGAGEIDKAKAAFVTGQRLGPDYFRNRLEGTSVYARPEDRTRSITFLRIAAGLEDPSAAESLR